MLMMYTHELYGRQVNTRSEIFICSRDVTDRTDCAGKSERRVCYGVFILPSFAAFPLPAFSACAVTSASTTEMDTSATTGSTATVVNCHHSAGLALCLAWNGAEFHPVAGWHAPVCPSVTVCVDLSHLH